jgi:hypothetical protein
MQKLLNLQGTNTIWSRFLQNILAIIATAPVTTDGPTLKTFAVKFEALALAAFAPTVGFGFGTFACRFVGQGWDRGRDAVCKVLNGSFRAGGCTRSSTCTRTLGTFGLGRIPRLLWRDGCYSNGDAMTMTIAISMTITNSEP